MAGGTLDVCVFLRYGHVFANAQTGNLVFVAFDAIQGRWADAAAHVPPVIGFVLGTLASLEFAGAWRGRIDAAAIRFSAEAAALVAMGVLAPVLADPVVTGTIGFLAAVQTTSLGHVGDVSISTVMTTGNLRTALSGLVKGRGTEGDERRRRRAGAVFLIALSVAFVVGAVLGGIVALRVGGRAFLLSAALVAAAVTVLRRSRDHAMPSAAL